MRVRCDKQMRKSKERAIGIKEFGVSKWKCSGDCYKCICGIVKDDDGTESHVKITR